MLSTDLTEFIRSVTIALTLTDRNEKRNGTKGPNRTQIPKWTLELPKHLNGPTYTAEG